MASRYTASLYNYLFNTVNTVVVIINGIVLVPVYFHYISLSTYGAWLASGNVVGMLGLLEAGFASVITQKLSASISKKDEKQFQKLAGANVLSSLIIGLTMFFLGILISSRVPSWVNCDATDANDIRLAFLISLSSTCIGLLVSFMGAFPQVWQKTKAIGIINVFTNILSILSLIIYLLCGLKILSIPLSYLTRAIANMLFQGGWIYKYWKISETPRPVFDIAVLLIVLKACFFPLVSKIANALAGHSQSFLLAFFINPTISAVYELTSKVAKNLCTFISNANGSFFALFALTISKGDIAETNNVFKKISSLFIFALLGSMMLTLFSTKVFMNYWVGLDKFGGYLLLALIILDVIYTTLNGYINNVMYCAGLINKSAILDMLKMGVYMVLLLGLIPVLHEYSVPLTSFITSTLFLIWYFRLLAKIEKINIYPTIKYLSVLSIISLVFIVFGFFVDLYFNNILLLALLNFLLFVLCFIALSMADKAVIAIIICRVPVLKKIAKKHN